MYANGILLGTLLLSVFLTAACGGGEQSESSARSSPPARSTEAKPAGRPTNSGDEQRKRAVRAELAQLYAETEPACRALQKLSSRPVTASDLNQFQANTAEFLDLSNACNKHIYRQCPLELELAVLEGILTPAEAKSLQAAGFEAVKRETERIREEYPKVFRNSY